MLCILYILLLCYIWRRLIIKTLCFPPVGRRHAHKARTSFAAQGFCTRSCAQGSTRSWAQGFQSFWNLRFLRFWRRLLCLSILENSFLENEKWAHKVDIDITNEQKWLCITSICWKRVESTLPWMSADAVKHNDLKLRHNMDSQPTKQKSLWNTVVSLREGLWSMWRQNHEERKSFIFHKVLASECICGMWRQSPQVRKITVFFSVPASQTFLGHIIPELRVEKTHCISQCSSFRKRSVVSDAKNVK